MATRKQQAAQVEAEVLDSHHEQIVKLQFETGLQALEGNIVATLETLGDLIHAWNKHQGLWDGEFNMGEKVALLHSELGKLTEADRANAESDKIPGFSGVEEELADVFIRGFDLAGGFDLSLAEAIVAKLRYNLSRPRKHGKAY